MFNIFLFTFKEGVRGKMFFVATVVVSLIFFLGAVGIYGFMANSQQEDQAVFKTNIQKVVIENKSSYPYLDFAEFSKVAQTEYQKVKFQKNSEKSLPVLRLEQSQSGGLLVSFIKPNQSQILDEEGEKFLENVTTYISRQKLKNCKIEQSKLAIALSPVTTDYVKQGEEGVTLGEKLLKLLVPMVLIMTMYFMILIYGQSIGKSVIAEKSSKLMETLLLSARPHWLVGGKILAMSLIGILQFVSWMSALILGVISGHYVGLSIYAKFQDPVVNAIELLRKAQVGQSFSAPALVLGVVALLIGFTCYCVFAALVASRVSKADDLAQAMGVFQMVVLVGFFASYFSMLQDNAQLVSIERWIPVTAPFILPSQIVLGDVGISLGILLLMCLLVCMCVLVYLTGRIYRNQVFYNGK